MLKKSNSDLSTTLISAKDSNACKTNNDIDNEQIEIQAIITSYSTKEDSKKLFKKNYISF